MKKAFDPTELTTLKALHDHVIVQDMDFQDRFSPAGIYIPSDDKTVQGVRPRWAQVYTVGHEQNDITAGQWVLVSHGRWTRGVKIRDASGEHTIRRIDTNDILAVSDEEVLDETMGRPL